MKQIYCRTSLDLFNEDWPTHLPEIPREGEIIESKTKHGDFRLSLRVERVRWGYTHTGYVPIVELHDTHSRSIRGFYEWYAPLVGKSVGAFI